MKSKKTKTGKKRFNLFTKYYLAISATVIASLLVLGTIFSGFLYNYGKEKTIEGLEAVTTSIAEVASSAEVVSKPYENIASAEHIHSSVNAYAKINACDVLIIAVDGRFVKSSSGCLLTELPEELEKIPELTGGLQGGSTHFSTRLSAYGGRVLVVASPITMGNGTIGTVLAIKKLSVFLPYVEDILRLFVISALGSLIISVLAAYYLVYRVYKPISQLKLATQKISEGDYSFRVEIDGEDEFAYLGNAFNSMARDLSALESSRRNFIANVSHELKTPMTTIGGYIDAIMDGTIDCDKQDHYLAIVSSEIKRLSRLVVAMLNLSKIEAGERKLEKKNVNLTGMLIEVMISFEQAIEKNHIEVIGLDKIGDVIANVDRDMMYQVFYNLTDNAVKFTDPGGRILVSLTSSGGKVGFRIINECSGISKEDISKIFERFYKVDRSRNLDIQGFGLGLYIAKTIVTMHGGQITARSNEGSDCEFLFWIPTN